MRRFLLLLLLLTLLTGCVMPAQAAFAPAYGRLALQMESGEPINVTLSAVLFEWLPFTKERLELFNKILRKTAIDMVYEGGNNAQTQFALSIGDRPVVTVGTTREGTKETFSSNLLGETILVAGNGQSPLDALFGTEATMDSMNALLNESDAFTLMDSLAGAYAQLLTFEVEGKTAKTKKKLPDIGTSASVITYTLTKEQAQTMFAKAIGSVETPFLLAALRGLAFEKDGIKVTRYIDKNGQDMGQNWVFSYISAGQTRKATLLWTFLSDGDGRKDLITLQTTNPAGKDKQSFAANCRSWTEAGADRLAIQTENSKTVDGQKCLETYDVALQNVSAKNNERLFGDIKWVSQVGEATEGLTLSPSLVMLDYGDRIAMSGAIRVKTLKDGVVSLDAEISLTAKEAEPIAVPVGTRERDVAALSADAFQAIQKSAAEAFVKNIVTAVLTLPREDLALVTQWMDEDGFSQVMDALVKIIPSPSGT